MSSSPHPDPARCQRAAPVRSSWTDLRDPAFSVAVVLLIVGAPITTPARDQTGRGELRIRRLKLVRLFILQKVQGTLDKKLQPLRSA